MKSRTRSVLTTLAVVAMAASGPTAQAAGAVGGTERPAVLSTGVELGATELSASVAPIFQGMKPHQLQTAYGLKGLDPEGRRVVVASPYGYGYLEPDLAQFRALNGLPPCTTDTGCLRVVDQDGGGDLPPGDPQCTYFPYSCFSFAQALTLDTISAVCPKCGITVVQSVNTVAGLDTAVDTAAAQPGAAAVVLVGVQGDGPERPAYNHPGVALVAVSGDGCCGGRYPAVDRHVVAVGETSLVKAGKHHYTESAYTGGGSGCSRYVFEPRWQRDIDTGCSGKRAVGDVAAAGDPNAGGIVVINNGYSHLAGGGTEAAAIIGAVFTLSGHTKRYPAKRLYRAKSARHLHDITTGSDGACGPPLCAAQPGWDGPTGVGTPKGVKAF